MATLSQAMVRSGWVARRSRRRSASSWLARDRSRCRSSSPGSERSRSCARLSAWPSTAAKRRKASAVPGSQNRSSLASAASAPGAPFTYNGTATHAAMPDIRSDSRSATLGRSISVDAETDAPTRTFDVSHGSAVAASNPAGGAARSSRYQAYRRCGGSVCWFGR